MNAAGSRAQPGVALELEREQFARPRRPRPAEVPRAGVEQVLQSLPVRRTDLPLTIVRAMVAQARKPFGEEARADAADRRASDLELLRDRCRRRSGIQPQQNQAADSVGSIPRFSGSLLQHPLVTGTKPKNIVPIGLSSSWWVRSQRPRAHGEADLQALRSSTWNCWRSRIRIGYLARVRDYSLFDGSFSRSRATAYRTPEARDRVAACACGSS